jgi:hypothetical protein
MAITVSAGSSSFVPCPQGVHQAVCCDVIDMGRLETTWNGQKKIKHVVRLAWQVEEMMDDGKPYIVQSRYTASLHEKSRLRKDLESWRGRPFSEAELRAFDLEVLIGVNCLLNVVQTAKNGTTYANVTAVMPLKKGMEKILVQSYTRVIDRQEQDQRTPGQPDDDDGPPPITDDDIPF